MPVALPSVPGFSEQQVHDLINIVHSIMQQYFAPPNQPPPASTPPPSTPPTSQEAQKEEDEQLLQQTTVEDITERTTKPSSMPDRQSTISTILRLCTVRYSGDSAACLSNLACQHIMLLYTLLGYIGHSKGIEATGQG